MGFTSVFGQETKVYLVPTLLTLHQTNKQYSYDSLRAVIGRARPDVVAVEIRPEDMEADSAYFRRNYSYEMWMVKYWFPSIIVKGMDWLGDDIAGKPIPYRYWQDVSRIKYLQRRLEIDEAYSAKLKNCQLYDEQRMSYFRFGTLKNIFRSTTDILTKSYFDCLHGQLQGSDYEELTRYYDKRNATIRQNVTNLINDNKGKNIVVLTGYDRYPYLLDHLRRQGIKVMQP
ncbi:hypothetical protein V9K67_22520 [Paraflavisolibacter sp. H34]|uniref:hypothetical protein n=1 Tax=Huijunlia imazamoxiresistens TaxID=3127457 RepID=UPI00301817D8